MKLKFHHPEPSARELTGPRYWRSLDELAATPAFKGWVEREFPAGASELEGVNRRNFLKVMAASFGLAGLGMSGCRQPTRHLLPYSKQPERTIPGVPVYYTTSLPGPLENVPLIVETNDARPTKLEGNPSYATFGGSTNIFAQASILDLYDPDRAGADGTALKPAEVEAKLNKLVADYAPKGGAGLAFLANKSTSPTRARIVEKLRAKLPQAIWAEYEPVDQSNPEKAATALYGAAVRPIYDFSQAKRVLALDSDFLNTEPGHLGYARGYAKSRKVDTKEDADPEKMSRLYVAESNYTITGANADHRLRCATTHIPGLTALFAAEFVAQATPGQQADLVAALKKIGAGVSVKDGWVKECVADLLKHKGSSAVIAGPELPVEVHQAVMMMNLALQAEGKTVTYRALPTRSATASIADVAAAIDAKKVQTLFILNGNPAYNAPGNLNFAGKLDAAVKAKSLEVFRYGYYGPDADETSKLATTFVPALHYLESWGDGLTWDGHHVPVQPMIQPLFEAFGELDVLGILSGDAKADAYAYVQETFKSLHPGKSFEEWLAVGVAADGFAAASKANSDGASALSKWTYTAPALSEKSLEVRFITAATWDGRYANNGWMQECPDAMTKITWDNAILISPKLAKALKASGVTGLWPEPAALSKGPLGGAISGQAAMNDNVFETGREKAKIGEITVNGKTIRGPLSILPGLADYSLVVALGYGRTQGGRVAGNAAALVGFNAYPIVSTASVVACAVAGAALKVVEEEIMDLANVQEHWSMEGREFVREANVGEYHDKPDFAKGIGMEAHSPPIYGPAKNMSNEQKAVEMPRGQSLYELHPYNKPAPNYPAWNTEDGLAKFPTPQQWGMSIDLNTCLGCNACIVACQAENNIPVVGKDQVLRGREMQWIRLDRYFASPPDTSDTDLPEDPQVNFQSMACQHCELAPCENVCPFMATVHDDQGLNTMAYNRCVGTKYCANNCPFKVRRFNFFDWNKRSDKHYYEGPLGPQNYNMTGGDVSPASQLTRMQKNPNVSIRMRGVMEKCTYCVQRIESAKINQRVKAQDSGDIKIPDGTLKTACQQVCPTGAIEFGDVSDPKSAVAIAKDSPRNYATLGYLNIRPRTTYLAKLRNPNKEMPDYRDMPLGRLEFETRYGHKHEAAEPKAAEPAKPAVKA